MPALRYSTLLLVALLLLSACSKPAPPPSPPPALTTIRVASFPNFPEDPLLDRLIAAFQQQHTQYRVEKIYLTSRETNAALTQARERQVDLMPLDFGDTQTMRRSMQTLDPFIAKSNFDLVPYGPAIHQFRVQGELRELPYIFVPTLLLYNTDMARAAGVTIPLHEWSWEELRVAAQRLTRGEGAAKVWGLNADLPALLVHSWVEQRTGDQVWNANPDVVDEALAFFDTLVRTDRSMTPTLPGTFRPGSYYFPHSFVPLERFNAGGAAISVETLASVQLELYPFKVPWAVAPAPALPGARPVTVGEGRSLGLLHSSPQPDVAWEFLRFVAGPEGSAVLARAGYLPMYRTDAALTVWNERANLRVAGMDSVWNSTWRLDLDHSPSLASADRLRLVEHNKAVNQTLSLAKTREEAMAEFRQFLAGK